MQRSAEASLPIVIGSAPIVTAAPAGETRTPPKIISCRLARGIVFTIATARRYPPRASTLHKTVERPRA